MAGEKRGRLLEAWLIGALPNQLRGEPIRYVWDEPRADLAVKPDVLIVDSDGKPLLLALVTWGGSRTNVKEKFWRDIGELVDARLEHPSLRVMSLRATERFVGKEMAALALIADGHVAVSALPGGEPLLRAIEESATGVRGTLPKERALEMTSAIAREHGAAAVALRSAIERVLDATVTAAPEITVARARLSSLRFPAARTTHVRLAVAQLLVLEPPIRDGLLGGRSMAIPNGGLARQCGALRADVMPKVSTEIQETLQLLGRPLLLDLVARDTGNAKKHLDKLKIIADTNLSELATQLDTLCDADRILERLADPEQRPRIAIALRTLVGLRFGKQGSGLLDRMAELTGLLRPQLHGIILPRLEAGASIDSRAERGIASAYAEKLAGLTAREVIGFQSGIDELVRYQFRNGLMCHGVDPLRQIVEMAADRAGRELAEVRVPAWIGPKVEARFGTRFSGNDLSTRCVRIGRSFVHWKSAYDGNEGHKTKELAGRAFGMRQWHQESETSRSNLILVLDGEFTTANIRTLSRSGWDEIFYPDDVDRIAQAVV